MNSGDLLREQLAHCHPRVQFLGHSLALSHREK